MIPELEELKKEYMRAGYKLGFLASTVAANFETLQCISDEKLHILLDQKFEADLARIEELKKVAE